MLVLVVMPLGYLLYGAVRSGPPRSDEAHFTLDNLSAIYGSIRFLQPFLTTLLIGVATGIGVALVGVALSCTVVRTDIPRPGLCEKVLILPLYLSPLMLISEEHPSALKSLMRISYALFFLNKNNFKFYTT